MLKNVITLCAVLFIFILSGCKETRSEAWYKQHPDETYKVYVQCLKDGEASDNCEFARRAAIMFAQIGTSDVKENFETLFRQEAERRKNTLSKKA